MPLHGMIISLAHVLPRRRRLPRRHAEHERVRAAARTKGRVSIQPVLPMDILGAYVLLPKLN